MVNATHAEAVAALKSVTNVCLLVVSREVLVVLPEGITEEDEEGEEEEERGEVVLETEAQLPPPSVTVEKTEEEEIATMIVAEVLDRSLNR